MSSSAPQPIWARLQPSQQAQEVMTSARGKRDAKRALQASHDELAVTLLPKLQALRDRGDVIDFATSWLLAEVVVHARPDSLNDVCAEMMTYPELRDVTNDLKAIRRRLRKL